MIKLHNGDCLEILNRMVDVDFKDCVIVTDPPFNINYHYRSYKDKMSEEDYYKWLGEVVGRSCPFVLIHYPESLYKFAIRACAAPTRVVSWVYNSNTRKQHRDIAFFGIEPDFTKVTQPYKNPTDKRIKKLIERGRTGSALYDWWNVNQVKNVSKEKTGHPCQMPLEIMKNIIGILPENLTIIDPFMGSGTTGVAAKELGRSFIGIEIDEEYFKIAKGRIGIEA